MDAMLRKRLKTWQNDFRTKHQREPKRSDIARVPEIAAIYDAWTALQATKGSSSSSSSGGQDKGKAKASAPSKSSASSAVASTSTSAQPPPRPPPAMAPPATPTKGASRSQQPFPPRTPTSSHSKRNPFRTPTKPASKHTSQSPSPSAAAAGAKVAPSTPQSQRNADASSSYHYNTSPTSFRDLVGAHSAVRTPNNRKRYLSEKADEAALLQKDFTPRTRARKRLRGEEVPPTPQSSGAKRVATVAAAAAGSAGSPSKAVKKTAAAAAPIAAGKEARPRKRRAQAEGGLAAFWGQDFARASSTTSSSSAGDDESAGPSGTSSKPRVFARQTSSQHQVQLQPERAKKGDGDDGDEVLDASPPSRVAPNRFELFQRRAERAEEERRAAVMSGGGGAGKNKRFKSLFDEAKESGADGMDAGTSDDDDDEDDEDSYAAQQAGHDIDMAEDVAMQPHSSTAAAAALRFRPAAQVALLDFSSSSEDESDSGGKGKGKPGQGKARKAAAQRKQKTPTGSASPSKMVYLRAYQRFGELSIGEQADGTLERTGASPLEKEDEEDDDDLDDVARMLSPAKRRAFLPSYTSEQDGEEVEEGDNGDDEGDDFDDSDARPTPSSHAHVPPLLERAPNALRSMQQHRKATERRALAALLADDGAAVRRGGEDAEARRRREDNEALVAELEREIAESGEGSHAADQQNGGRGGGQGQKGATWGRAKAEAKRQAQEGGFAVGKRGRSRAGEDGFLLGKAKRGAGTSLGTALSDDEDAGGTAGAASKGKGKGGAGKAAAAAQPAKSSKVFRRVGRSGVDDDEGEGEDANSERGGGEDVDELEPSQRRGAAATSGDEDWASEADSGEDGWGVGDGMMEETDVW